MIRSRAACWLLAGLSTTALFGCGTSTEHSASQPTAGSIGIAHQSSSGLGVSADRLGFSARAVPEAIPSTTLAAPSTTLAAAPATTTAPPEPAAPVASPAPEAAGSNELMAAPTTTARPPVARKTSAAPATTKAPSPLEPAAAPSVVMDPASASDVAARTNGVRAGVGLPSLARNGSLDAMAANWARELALSGNLRHSSSPNGAVAKGWAIAGENVGYGASSAVVHDALVGSPGHYSNLVGDRYTNIGVGAARSADGRLWVCEVFAG